jgi:hypothetical protein
MQIRAVLFAFVGVLVSATARADDWAYTLAYEGDEWKQIWSSGHPPTSCDSMGDDPETIYLAIRDAGLFRVASCAAEIDRLPAETRSSSPIDLAIAFYRLRMGDHSRLRTLLDVFDREARQTGDHLVIELFGFLPDWEQSGRRLARVATYADGAVAELLNSALTWKRFLYGHEKGFREECFKVWAEEHANSEWATSCCGAAVRAEQNTNR